MSACVPLELERQNLFCFVFGHQNWLFCHFVTLLGFVASGLWGSQSCPQDLQVEENRSRRDLVWKLITDCHRECAQDCCIPVVSEAFVCKTGDRYFLLVWCQSLTVTTLSINCFFLVIPVIISCHPFFKTVLCRLHLQCWIMSISNKLIDEQVFFLLVLSVLGETLNSAKSR